MKDAATIGEGLVVFAALLYLVLSGLVEVADRVLGARWARRSDDA